MMMETLDEERDAAVLSKQFYGLVTGSLWDGPEAS